eukprot:Gb_22474 [translate_table: standard]
MIRSPRPPQYMRDEDENEKDRGQSKDSLEMPLDEWELLTCEQMTEAKHSYHDQVSGCYIQSKMENKDCDAPKDLSKSIVQYLERHDNLTKRDKKLLDPTLEGVIWEIYEGHGALAKRKACREDEEDVGANKRHRHNTNAANIKVNEAKSNAEPTEHIMPYNLTICKVDLIHYGSKNDELKCLTVFQRFKESGMEPSIISFGCLIQLYTKRGKVSKALEASKDMEAYGIKHNKKTYSMLINGYVQLNDCATTFVIFEEMKRASSKPDVPIGGCYRLIDVSMSTCINSGINKFFILTQFNFASLSRHLACIYNFGNGVNVEDGIVEPLIATQTPSEDGMRWFQGTGDAMRQFTWLFEDVKNMHIENILILSSDHLYQMDYMNFIQKHINTRADITIPCIPKDGNRNGSGYNSTGIVTQEAKKAP